MGQAVKCSIGSVTVLLDVEAEAAEGETKNFEKWRADTYATKEPDTIRWIDSFVRPGDVLYDVGANIGQYALYAARRLEGKCRVLAFEPEALNYAKLNRNIVLNGLTEKVTAYCLAVADRTAIDYFYVKSFAPGAALHTWGRPVTQGEAAFPPKNRQGTMGVSLDDLTERFGLPFPAHIKVDVDGIEESVVKGARKVLADRRLKTVLIEVFMHGDTARRIEAVFLAEGFALSNAETVDYAPGIVQNLIFVRGARA
jgi:FkbM family methyltransferase